MPSLIDITGKRFGRWNVISRAPNMGRKVAYNCICDCGAERVVLSASLRSGLSTSCGCRRDEVAASIKTTHGMHKTRLYYVWSNMRARCQIQTNPNYNNYGGRGISVCPEWEDFETFYGWAIQTGYDEEAPRGNYTIDRIDVNGPYAPWNCRWANTKEQSNNKRTSRLVTVDGVTKSVSEWAVENGISPSCAFHRIRRGYSDVDAIQTQPKHLPTVPHNPRIKHLVVIDGTSKSLNRVCKELHLSPNTVYRHLRVGDTDYLVSKIRDKIGLKSATIEIVEV